MLTASDISDATQAVIFRAPSMTNNNSSGSAATTALHASEPATGSRTCWYMSHLAVVARVTSRGGYPGGPTAQTAGEIPAQKNSRRYSRAVISGDPLAGRDGELSTIRRA